MGDSQAYEQYRKTQGLPPIPEWAELFKVGKPAVRKKAYELLRLYELTPESDRMLRRRLAAARRHRDNAANNREHRASVAHLLQLLGETETRLERILAITPGVEKLEAARQWCHDVRSEPAPPPGKTKRKEGLRRNMYQAFARRELMALPLTDRKKLPVNLTREDVDTLLSACGIPLPGGITRS
jgi:hypothetical protein